MTRVLFACVGNAGRSQMAQAFFERAADGAHEVRSAGTRPEERVHPEVVLVMRERGFELSGKVPHKLDRDDVGWADMVVTMGCGDECPVLPGKQYIDWELTDPMGKPLDEVRSIRDEIDVRVRALLADLDGAD